LKRRITQDKIPDQQSIFCMGIIYLNMTRKGSELKLICAKKSSTKICIKMFSISRHRNNILKITNNKIIAIKSYVSFKFSYKNIFILVSNATVLYEICTTLMPSNMNITNINTHIQPVFCHLHVIYRFLQSAILQQFNLQCAVTMGLTKII